MKIKLETYNAMENSVQLVCHRYLESVQLWPESSTAHHSQQYTFSLKPPRKGVDRVQHPDYFKFEVGRNKTLKPCHYKSEKSLAPYKVEKTNTDRFCSTLDIHLQNPYVINGQRQECNDISDIILRNGYCKRSLLIKHQ